MGKYLFISNSSKKTNLDYESIDTVKLGNVSLIGIDAASKLSYQIYMGVNRKYASDLRTDYDGKIKLYNADIYRNIFDFKTNYKAYKSLNKLLKEEQIDVIHCNTPIGGFLGRICGKKNKVNKIIYTAHGFHFYKGAPFKNNLIFKNIERLLAHYTDAIITMNKEDYEAAKKFKLRKGGKVYFTHGVGISLEQYKNVEINREKYYNELNLKKRDILLISMGDLVKRKNYDLSFEIISKCNNKNIKYLICGNGPELDRLKELTKKLNIEEQVKFLGFRKDIKELLKVADIFLFTTLQEGLPRSLMEAMASGLPCVVSDIRGNVDLIDDNKGGFLCNSIDKYVSSINRLIRDNKLKNEFKNYNLKKIKDYSFKKVKKEIYNIYKDLGL